MARRSVEMYGPAQPASLAAPPLRIIGTWIAAIVLVLACWTPVSEQAYAAEKVRGQLSVRDALGAAGKQVRVEARLARTGLGQSGLGGEPLEFLLQGEKAGQAMTGGDGRALFEATCRMRGTYSVTVRLSGSPRVESPDATGILACWERRRPILLVDLAALAKDPAPPFGLPPGLSMPMPVAAPEPAAEAAEELKRLTDYFYNVIYLSWSRREIWPGESDSRAWLRQATFPAGPLVMVDPGQAGLHELLDRLKTEGWDNVKVGIGRTREFAETLVARRIETVILPAGSRDEEVPKKAHVIKDWKEIRKKLRS